MSNVEKISVALPPEMVGHIRAAVASGNYSSSSEVVREALRDWKEKQERKAIALKELRRLWREGIESGPGQFGSIDEIIAEARRRYDNRRQKN